MNEEFDTFEDQDVEFAHDELERDWDEQYEPEQEEWSEHDDMYDIESALGSVGWGTDEYYGSWDE